MKAVLLLNGEPPEKDTLKSDWEQADLKVCADGAADTCLEYGLAPDVILGDFDSISEACQAALKSSTFTRLMDQDKTDGEKAVEFCIRQGANEVLVFGARGKRLDHELYNIGLLSRFKNEDIALRLCSETDVAWLINRTTILRGRPGSRISIIPVFGPVKEVTLKGFAYPLNNVDFDFGGQCSISNEFLDDTAEIVFDSGCLLVIMAADSITKS